MYFTYRDALLTSAVNCFTSFLAGFAVFSVLGHMAFKQHKSVENVSREGKEIVQIMYTMSNQSNVTLKYPLYTVIKVTLCKFDEKIYVHLRLILTNIAKMMCLLDNEITKFDSKANL